MLLLADLYRVAAERFMLLIQSENAKVPRVLGYSHSHISQSLENFKKLDKMADETQVARELFLVDDTYYKVMLEAKFNLVRKREESSDSLSAPDRTNVKMYKDEIKALIVKRRDQQMERRKEIERSGNMQEVEELKKELASLEEEVQQQTNTIA